MTNRGYRSGLQGGEGLDKEKNDEVDDEWDVTPSAACEDVAEDVDNGVEELEDRDVGEAA